MAKRPKKSLTAVPLVSAMVVTMGCAAEHGPPPMPPPMVHVAPMPPPMQVQEQETRDAGGPVAVPPMVAPPPMPPPHPNPPMVRPPG